MGSARSGEVAGKIFGQNLIKIRNISEFFTGGRKSIAGNWFFHEKYLHNILRYSMIVQSVKVTKSSERTFLKWLYR